MKPTEAAALLTIAAAYDNRKPDMDAAKAWAMALDGMRFEDCRDAVVAHYRATRDWMMPSDVIAIVKRIRRGRILAYGALPDPPAEIDPDDTRAIQRWEIEFTQGIADGTITTNDPQLSPGPRGPWTTEGDQAVLAARMKILRDEVRARQPKAIERPSLDELAANAVKADENRTRTARENA